MAARDSPPYLACVESRRNSTFQNEPAIRDGSEPLRIRDVADVESSRGPDHQW